MPRQPSGLYAREAPPSVGAKALPKKYSNALSERRPVVRPWVDR
jgi:hypothetical protein